MSLEKTGRLLAWWVKQAVLVVLVALFVSVFLIQTYDINDVSMEPTFDRFGNRVLVFLTPHLLKMEPGYGSIVIIDSRVDRPRAFRDRFVESPLVALLLRSPNEHMWVKRVIGLPGDRVEFRGGLLYLNGTAVEEEYVGEQGGADFGPVSVPAAHVFVMGDNRSRSSDSRQIGPVPLGNIQGRVFLRIFPFNAFQAY